MRYSYFLILIFMAGISVTGQTQARDIFSYEKSLRVDFVLTGNQDQQNATIAGYFQFPGYSAGPAQNIPSFDYGTYRLLLLSEKTSDTLFIKGISTLFEEWQFTKEAKNVNRVFEQTVEMPYPKESVNLIIECRKKNGNFTQLTSETFNPNKQRITTLVPHQHPHKIIHGIESPTEQADILFIAEGYRINETEKFYDDAEKMTNYLFSISPYDELKDKITVRALALPSIDSGTDDPNKNIWKNTAMNSSFNTFGADRYLESLNAWTIFNYAALLPHDHIVILVNSKKYGGGGVYNHFSITSAANEHSEKVFVHELGHGLAGLGDEYYYPNVPYDNFFDLNTEPWHPNITTLVNFESKWKNLLPDSIPIPTPDNRKYKNSTGVFEGAGYSQKDIYRPAVNCRMKSNEAEGFCEVCRKSIKEAVCFYNRSLDF